MRTYRSLISQWKIFFLKSISLYTYDAKKIQPISIQMKQLRDSSSAVRFIFSEAQMFSVTMHTCTRIHSQNPVCCCCICSPHINNWHLNPNTRQLSSNTTCLCFTVAAEKRSCLFLFLESGPLLISCSYFSAHSHNFCCLSWRAHISQIFRATTL